MNTEKTIKSIYFLISFGILLVIGCTAVALFHPVSKSVNILNTIFIAFQAGIGVATVIIAIKFTKKFFHIFMGLLYLSWSIIYLFAYTLFSYSLKEMWPLLGISAGILWFIAGRLKYQTLKFGFLILFFFLQQKHTELVFPDEETGDFADEESSIKSDLEEDD